MPNLADEQFVFTFLLSYPLAAMYTRLPPSRPNIAHIYSLVISFFFFWPFLHMGGGLLQMLFSCAGAYLIILTSRSSNMPWMVFV